MGRALTSKKLVVLSVLTSMRATLAATGQAVVGQADDGGGGGGWLLGGTAELAQDPENPANDVIKIDTTVSPFFGTVSRTVDVKITELDNMLEFKAWFKFPKTCFGGSPRFQLAIDLNGDGVPEGNAFGYFGPSPGFTGCLTQTWLSEDLTGGGDGPFPSTGQATPNEEAEWDLTQLGCPVGTLPPGPPNAPCIVPPGFVTNWSNAENIISAFPNHRVCTVALVDDTFLPPSPPNVMSGVAYYDLISGGRATWVDRTDIAGRGFAQGCGRADHADDG